MPFGSAAGLWLKRYRRRSIKLTLNDKWTALHQRLSPMPRKNDIRVRYIESLGHCGVAALR